MTTTQINDNTAVLRDVFPAGSVAFVSGASRGIGAACATALAAAGCNLAITYRRKENEAAQIAESIEAIGRQCITCLLYTSPSPRDKRQSRMPSSA